MMTTASLAPTDASVAAAALFHGLSDPSRVSILRHLLLGEHNVRELTDHLGLAQSTVSGHLACLRGCGLVTSRTVGRSSRFSVTDPTLVNALFAATEDVLAVTGEAVVLCPSSGPGATP
ncbi:Transcriptional regulator, ArsR family [Serinicoccus hydrothermalis]|uniref:Transcriptional regulator, ArsR family n=1 Tax=Serinicoccus hydrothermalis TaxID=1758689 RepID=A0A1B1NC31_9MICO|nr:metalloregulator ArsR/SmtB family transcription factor [Serinicoccus hydrothermalis]ANS78987.1 Transcriptional regulator, ArsR family [Serinicoccus hydrothermalis]